MERIGGDRSSPRLCGDYLGKITNVHETGDFGIKLEIVIAVLMINDRTTILGYTI
jgi:hypothetical protein